MTDNRGLPTDLYLGSIRISDAHFLKEFESLPVANLLQINPEKVEELKDAAKRIVINDFRNKQSNSFAEELIYSITSLKDLYHLASKFIIRTSDNKVFSNSIEKYIEFNNPSEQSLFAMFICDADCRYYNMYDKKRKLGMSNEEALDYLDLYFGIKSPKLIQIERLYQVLLLRQEKSKMVGIFDVDTPPSR